MKSYQNLDVWNKSRKVVSETYELTKGFLKSEKYGLVSQMRKASVFIPSNIAEGYGRKYNKEKVRFILSARRSIYELETPLFLCLDPGFIKVNRKNDVLELCKDIKMMMNGLISFLKNKPISTI
ncbi:MAG: four helix bundle protein [Arcticibacterium sp.]|jgi:four helix bundle protein